MEQPVTPPRPKPLLREILFEYRSVIFSAFLLIYVLLLQRPLLGLVSEVSDLEKPNLWVAVLIIGVMVAEFIGLHLKMPAVFARIPPIRKDHPRKGEVAVYLVWPFHSFVTIFLISLAIPALGLKGNFWPLVVMGIAFAKEMYILLYAWGVFKFNIKPTPAGEFIGDALIFVWSMVAYTATWVYMSGKMELGKPSIEGEYFWQVYGGLLVFLMIFIPLKAPYLHEEFMLRRNRLRRWLFWGVFAANTVSAMLSFVFASGRW